MSMINVDTTNEDLFKPYEFKLMPNGKHSFEVANDLELVPSQSSHNLVIKVELRCAEEGEFKGAVVFDNFTIVKDPQTDKQRASKKINESRLSQFAVACGVCSEKEINATGQIPLELFKGRVCDAIVGTASYTDPNSQEARQKNKISRYLFAADEG